MRYKIKSAKYLLFTPDLHQALIKHGKTHLYCFGYIPNLDLNGKLNYNTPYKRKINGYAIRAFQYIPANLDCDYAVEIVVPLPKDPNDPERIQMLVQNPELAHLEELEKAFEDTSSTTHPYSIIKGYLSTPKIIEPGLVGAQTAIHLNEITKLYPTADKRFYVIFERYPSSVWKGYKKIRKCKSVKKLFGKILI